MKKKRTINNIEKEMKELYPKKELAYIDAQDNRGDSETFNRLWEEFEDYKRQWNKLVEKRKVLLNRNQKKGNKNYK